MFQQKDVHYTLLSSWKWQNQLHGCNGHRHGSLSRQNKRATCEELVEIVKIISRTSDFQMIRR